MVNGKWYRHFYGPVASAFQMMGTVMYLGCEASDGYKHIPAYVRHVDGVAEVFLYLTSPPPCPRVHRIGHLRLTAT